MSESVNFGDGKVATFRRELPSDLARALRRGRGPASLPKAARITGLSESFLKKLERGERVPSPGALDRLERAGYRLAPEHWAALKVLANGRRPT